MKKNDLKLLLFNTYVKSGSDGQLTISRSLNSGIEITQRDERKSDLANQLTEIVQRFDAETDTGMDAYTAELKVVEATRIIGKIMVE